MRGKLFLLSILSAVLLTAGWPPWGFTPLLFVALIPLFYVQHIVSGDNRLRAKHLFVYAYITFVAWNAMTTWWIWFASAGGACLAIFANAMLMALVFLVYHKLKRTLPERIGTFVFIPLWISFEFLHLDWDLTWPWLTLGNGLAGAYKWVQWYEYTGVFGGSLWILLVNVLLFELYIHRNTLLRPLSLKIAYISAVVLLLAVPAVSSLVRYNNFDVNENTTAPVNVVVVQPNIDPYKKFSTDFREMTEAMLMLAEKHVDENTDYVVMPETALIEDMWEGRMEHTWTMRRLRMFVDRYPKLKIITGASTGYEYEPGEQRSPTARKFKDYDRWFDAFNTALQVDCTRTVPVYHKSKLVPGVEKMPFPKVFGFLENFAIDLGGTSGSLGMQDERTVFVSPNGPGKVAPVICYESIYSDYCSEYIRNGADYIFIVTNDGWWGNTPGYKQHLLYGRLRAIETRKSIARSANTGISCFIDQRGDITDELPWWTEGAISKRIVSTAGQTFYTKHGDYIAKFMLWLSVAGFLAGMIRVVRKRMRRV